MTVPARVQIQDADGNPVDFDPLASALPPGTLTAITPSDSTNVTATCSRGIFVAVTGNVNVTGTGGSAVSLGTQVAGTRIELALSRVNAATTATVIGLS
jgi:hypothetical protein